ncbi:DUF4214 domain-containing protein [Duganella sp. FT92W]|uniref:DUF4214 domain-containing protein n=1 Tax=Pseudoduganella rivuli TaxID=2666085 RepID=A0A7X2LS05_9BURK|nr:DUF4214 domain-containing protein [Pseudoduganella rivuli]MRV71358.1 DUF4214 domain-containing protein [Pseudoduganella rivuli]
MPNFLSVPQPGGIAHGSVITFDFGQHITPGTGLVKIYSQAPGNTLLYAFNSASLIFGDTTLSLTLPATLDYGARFDLVLDRDVVKEDTGLPAGGRYVSFFEVEERPAPAQIQWTGAAGPDTIHGSTGVDLLQGGDGDDALYGHAGNDVLLGGASGPRGDTLYGMDGDDALFGQDGADTLYGGNGDDYLDGGDGNDALDGNAGDDELHGGNGNDTLTTAGGIHDILHGDDGYDNLYLYGGGGTLYGGSGSDFITILGSHSLAESIPALADGGDGDDYIQVQGRPDAGGVTVRGGAGRDTYATPLFFESEYLPTQVIITDFTAGADRATADTIDVRGMMPPDYTAGNPFGADGVLRLVQQGADTLLQIDRDGASGPAGYDNVMILQGVQRTALTAANFNYLSPDGGRAGITDNSEGHLDGTLADDILWGSSDHDHMAGFNGNDVLYGGDGNDEFKGGYGADTLHGGAGTDTARYDFDNDNPYTVLFGVDGSLYVMDRRNPADLDKLDGVERIVFTQDHRNATGIAYDVEGTGGDVFRLYLAAVGSAPATDIDRAVLGLMLKDADHGVPLLQLAHNIVASREFQDQHGQQPGSAALVTSLYRTALHREPDAAGLQYWSGLLDSKAIDAAGLLVSMAGSEEHHTLAATIIGSSFDYLASVPQW